MVDLGSIIKAYDVRGVVPEAFDEEIARAIGAAFAIFCGGPSVTPRVVIAYDMRPSSIPLSTAFAEGVCAQGINVVDAGLGSTDLLYYASGAMNIPGAMFTASHNPAQYNGIKMCRAAAAPIGQDSGLLEIRANAERFLDGRGIPTSDAVPGTVEHEDVLAAYATYLRGLVDISGIRHLKVVVDAGNGMGGHTVPAVLDNLPLTIIPLYFELDGTFPNHEANPIEPENLVDLQKAVLEHGADIGLAFDGDADRCFVVDETGAIVSPSVLTALIASRELAKEPGATIIHNLITSRAVPEIVTELGGVPIRTRVGHSFIKERMAETGAIFGGEHSGHFYFRDFWRADSGMLAALHTLAALGEQGGTLSALLSGYARYSASGEINSVVSDQAATTAAIEADWGQREGVTLDHLDGLTVSLPNGDWFNLRPSNTEPLLRLNAEAATGERLASLRDEVLAAIRS